MIFYKYNIIKNIVGYKSWNILHILAYIYSEICSKFALLTE